MVPRRDNRGVDDVWDTHPHHVRSILAFASRSAVRDARASTLGNLPLTRVPALAGQQEQARQGAEDVDEISWQRRGDGLCQVGVQRD